MVEPRPRRRWLRWLALPPLLWLAACALMYFQQRSLIYYPQATGVAIEDTDFALDRGEAMLRGWVVNDGRTDALLYFGGNAERVEYNRAPLARALPGRSLYLPAYRGYGASTGQPSEKALLADALALFDEVRRRHPQGRIAVMGRSLGSGVASHVAAHRPVERLVLVTPFDSLAAVAQAHYPWLPVRWLMHDVYPSTDHLPRYPGELLILRAGQDVVVPPRHTDRLIAALPRAPRVVVFARAGHNDLSDDPRYWQAVADFLGTD